MLTQRLVGNQETNTGTLTITADAGQLPALVALRDELERRPEIYTEGTLLEGDPAPVG